MDAPKCKICGKLHWGLCLTAEPASSSRAKAGAKDAPKGTAPKAPAPTAYETRVASATARTEARAKRKTPAEVSAAHKANKAKVRAGTKFIAEVPAGTKLLKVGEKVIAAGPNTPASIVTDTGLEPIVIAKKRKGDRHRPGYMVEYQRKRRAAAKGAK